MTAPTTLQEKQEEVIEDFAIYDDWMEKYEYLIELGKDLPKIADDEQIKHWIFPSGYQTK
jgi:cysteine desulfuration protein SufE